VPDHDQGFSQFRWIERKAAFQKTLQFPEKRIPWIECVEARTPSHAAHKHSAQFQFVQLLLDGIEVGSEEARDLSSISFLAREKKHEDTLTADRSE
jgi:hypothetical protein